MWREYEDARASAEGMMARSAPPSLTAHLKNGAQALKSLPDIAQLSPSVWRFLGRNPGPYTLQSTNTYLVGRGEERILIDTGEGNSAYLDVLAAGMERAGCKRISEIVITHWHHDHLGGVPSVLRMSKVAPPPVRKFMPQMLTATPQVFGTK